MFLYNPNNNPKRNSISLTKDLIDEWEEKTGKPRALLEEMLSLHVDYIKYLMNEEKEAINIRLPALGVLILNFFMVGRYLKGHPKHEVMLAKKAQMDECIKNHGWDFINFNRLMVQKQNYLATGEAHVGIFKNFYSLFKKVSEVNNEHFMEKYRGGG